MQGHSTQETRLIAEHGDSLRPNEVGHNVANILDQKAQRARRTGMISFCLTMLIGIAIISLFLFSHGLEPPSETKTETNATGNLAPQGMVGKIIGGDVKTNQITETLVKQDIYFQIANTAIIRVGSVLLAIFLIQILVGFSRYYFRVAEHLSACADIVRLSRGDAPIIKELASTLLPSVEFGKMPNSPVQVVVDKAMDTVKELAKKIPAK